MSEPHWFRGLKDAGPGTDNKYVAEYKSVWFSDMGDGVFICESRSTNPEFSNQYCELLNGILSDPSLRELVARRLEKLKGS